jgi:hypothetical protein
MRVAESAAEMVEHWELWWVVLMADSRAEWKAASTALVKAGQTVARMAGLWVDLMVALRVEN